MIVSDDAQADAMRALVAAGMDASRPIAKLASTSLARHLIDQHNPVLTESILRVAGLAPAVILKLMFPQEAVGR